MQETATPALALLQPVADDDRSMPRRELRKAREMVATLARGCTGRRTGCVRRCGHWSQWRCDQTSAILLRLVIAEPLEVVRAHRELDVSVIEVLGRCN